MAGIDRGQAYALEGVVGALLIAFALVLGVQVVDVAPWSDSGDRALEQAKTQADDVLAIARDDELLRKTLTCVDDDGDPRTVDPSTAGNGFETLLAGTLQEQGGYTIEVEYLNRSTGSLERRTLLSQTVPDRGTVSTTTVVTLFDTDPVREGSDCAPTGKILETDGEFYLDNRNDRSDFYGAVTVRVILW